MAVANVEMLTLQAIAAPRSVSLSSSSSVVCSSLALRPRSVQRVSVRRNAIVAAAGDGAVAQVEATAEEAAPAVPIEQTFVKVPSVMDINEIMDIMPHRYPFLLIDKCIELVPGKTVVTVKNVTINDNFFPGHFPGRPVMPGVLQVEALAQSAGLLFPSIGGKKDSFFFAGVDKIRFRKPVLPGDTLVMRMTLLSKRFKMAKFEGKAYVGKDVVCEGEFLVALG